MCRFITAVVPADADLQASTPLLDKYDMSFKEVKTSFVGAQLESDRYVRATRSACDCDSVLGSASPQREAEQTTIPHSTNIEKLRKKGWSQHKIERWLSEKSGSLDRRQQQDKSKHDAELTQWCEFISALLLSGFTKRLGLLLHMYKGSIDDERIRIKRIEHLSLSEQLDNELLSMDEDVLYIIEKVNR
ncbi:MAG: hypothetical protein K2X81_09875 [Candidatus Obscuribacterales bacterium]|nr:hypothetical protein [Candidatus Obscuribacterales bacterium]